MTTTVYQADTWYEMTTQQRTAVKDWLIANSIDPREITPSEPITVTDNTITYWGMEIEAVEGKNMRVKAAYNDQGERCIVLNERTVPLLAAFQPEN